MRRITILAVMALLPICAHGQNAPATPEPAGESQPARKPGFAHAGTPADPLPAMGLQLDDFLWTARPLIVFSASPQDPGFLRQMQMLNADPAALLERQVVVITDPETPPLSDLRRRMRPNGFTIVLIDTNGRVLLTRPTPRSVREISAAIDKSPQRRQEIEDRRSGG